MEPTTTDIKRLAFARNLILKAREQAMLPSPLSSSAILSAQDAVEMFLIVVAQRLSLDPNKYQFMAFWEAFSEKGVKLPYKEPMRHLNECRVAIKHRGTFPSEFDVQRAVADAEQFLDESMKSLFGRDLSETGLLDFIGYRAVRDYLEKAVAFLAQGKFAESVAHSALAFSQLQEDYLSSRRIGAVDKPYCFSRFTALDRGLSIVGDERAVRKLGDFIDKTVETSKELDEAVKVLALGIDFDSYVVFKQLTPDIFRFAGGKAEPYWLGTVLDAVKGSDDAAEWCLDFVTESALKLSIRANPYTEPSTLLEESWKRQNEKWQAEFEMSKAESADGLDDVTAPR